LQSDLKTTKSQSSINQESMNYRFQFTQIQFVSTDFYRKLSSEFEFHEAFTSSQSTISPETENHLHLL
jgi:hypothetical protein